MRRRMGMGMERKHNSSGLRHGMGSWVGSGMCYFDLCFLVG